VRGTKLTAWRIPPVWEHLQENNLTVPENSNVIRKQKLLLRTTQEALTEVVRDVRQGLLETVGVESSFSIDEQRCAVVLNLPENSDTERIARAIDLENVEAWLDAENNVHLGISPWYSTKDVDQTVLAAVKVIHVLLGLHASEYRTMTFKEKLLKSVSEIMEIQKNVKNK
jgi:hypothetical protein